MPDAPWHVPSGELLSSLESNAEKGLSDGEVLRRLETYGANVLREHERRSASDILVDQFRSLIVLLLVVAAVAAFSFGESLEGFAVTIVVVVNAAIGFVTELRAVRSMAALRELGHVSTRVLRDGHEQTVDAESLVPGDVVVLDEGDIITADLRILEGSKLQADESTLTGESTPVGKSAEPIASDADLAERTSMLFKGTAITRGTGRALVVGTGMETELGHISALVESAEESRTPLEERLDRLGRVLIFVTLGVAAMAAVAGIVRGRDVVLMIEMGIALAVASVPEGLPVVATIALASGMRKMAARNALINRLSSVETLGATTVIFTDKTGTLTENRMTVSMIELASGRVDVTGEGLSTDGAFERDGTGIDPNEDVPLRRLLEIGVLCNNAGFRTDGESASPSSGHGEPEKSGTSGYTVPETHGDPTEVALLVAGAKAGIQRDELTVRLPERREEAFDPDLRMMATYHEDGRGFLIAVKGAADALLDTCDRILTHDGERPLTDADRENWQDLNAQLAGDGLRVLAFAYRRVASTDETPYEHLVFTGCAGLLDPARSDVRDAVKACHDAGIGVVMVTGDHVRTAGAIAEAVGIVDDGAHESMTGKDLTKNGDDPRIAGTRVFARVSPEQKLRLIRFFQERGEIVAMTGDGVNDAPALKSADIGIAMGLRGTQVAQQASDMILRDDAFSTIVAAVERGRIIFENIRRFVVFLLSCNVSEVLVVGLASIAGAPLPILPLHLLYLNFVTDVFPALALGVGRGDSKIMTRPPRPPDEAVMERRQWTDVAWLGTLITLSTLGAFAIAHGVLGYTQTESVSIAFLTIGFAQLLNVFNMRAAESGLFDNDVVRNPWVVGSIGMCTALLLIAVFVTPLADVLSIEPPGPTGWLIVVGASLVPLVVGQLGLVIRRARN